MKSLQQIVSGGVISSCIDSRKSTLMMVLRPLNSYLLHALTLLFLASLEMLVSPPIPAQTMAGSTVGEDSVPFNNSDTG
ncbi:MAG TPA: hypothetical protein V6D29_19970, partial [Leptolyngbyaceae cyanobacterium]